MKKADLEILARQIAAVIYHAHGAVLVGSPAAVTAALYQRMNDIRPGDLILEITTAMMAARPALDALGYFLRETQEPVDFGDKDFVWNEAEEGRPHPTEKCVYIRTLDGREFRWTNASFISAPTEYPMRGINQQRTTGTEL